MKKIKDHYFYKAKSENFRARSIYKLQEIQKKFQLIKTGDHILDLGSAPGSWCQFLAQTVGQQGRVVGIDLKPVEKIPGGSVETIQADIFTFDFSLLPKFNGITCDAAPNTTGIKDIDSSRSLSLLEKVCRIASVKLNPLAGFAVCKYLQGIPLDEVKALFLEYFFMVSYYKPKSSRSESSEIFVIGRKLKKNNAQDHQPANSSAP